MVSFYLGARVTGFIFQKCYKIPVVSLCFTFFFCSKEPYLHQNEFQGEAPPDTCCSAEPQANRIADHMAFFFLILSYLWTNSPSLFGLKYDFFISTSGWGTWSTISDGCEEDGKLGLGRNERYRQIGSTFRTEKTESASESVVLVCQCRVEWQCHNRLSILRRGLSVTANLTTISVEYWGSCILELVLR